jgi:hypothetical protein
MSDIDPIAMKYTTDLDRVYPPMKWTAQWSDAGNLPCALRWTGEYAALLKRLHCPDFYAHGLWLFSDEGHAHHLQDLGPEYAGRIVLGWNRREAEARLRDGA